MIEGPILSRLLLYSLPIMFSGILQLLYNAADIIVVGRFCGKESMAAVGSTGSLVNLLVNLFMGLAVGANVVVAQYYGAKNKKAISDSSHTAIVIAVICGVVIGAVGSVFSGTFLRLMDSPEDILSLSTVYLRIYFLGTPAVMLMNFGTSILRASGDTKRPLYIITVSGIINVLLNLLFVILFHMDVTGVALATIISQYFSAAVIMLLLIKTDEAYKISFRNLKIHPEMLKKIVSIGLPTGIQSSIFSISNVIIQSSINAYGSTILAGSTAAANIEGFVYTAMNSVCQAALTFVGQNVGARKPERIGKIWRDAMFLAIGTGLILCIIVYIFSTPLLSLYNEETAVIEWGKQRLLYIGMFYFLCGYMEASANTMRGLGKSLAPTIVTVLGVCGIRIVWVMTAKALGLANPQVGDSIIWIYVSYALSWFVTGTVLMLCFIHIKRKNLICHNL